jgi:hypothetical protein
MFQPFPGHSESRMAFSGPDHSPTILEIHDQVAFETNDDEKIQPQGSGTKPNSASAQICMTLMTSKYMMNHPVHLIICLFIPWLSATARLFLENWLTFDCFIGQLRSCVQQNPPGQ